MATMDIEEEPQDAPSVLGLSRSSVSVGQSIEFFGGNFQNGTYGHTMLRFEGFYDTAGGASHPVDLSVRPHWEDGNKLVWASVGPFNIPFSPTGDELGVFRGDITPINIDRETGEETVGQPAATELRIDPSVIIREFHPVATTCSAPVRRLLGNFTYKATVEAIGFNPVNFTYVIAGEPSADTPRIIRREAAGSTDSFGEDGEIYFEPVPGDRGFYQAIFVVAAMGEDGQEHHTGLVFGVHNPVEVIPLDRFELGEIEPAIPVSGCTSGGETNGREVTYTESQTDSRSRTFGINWNQEWIEQATQTNGGSTSASNGVSVQMTESESNGWETNYTHSFGKEASAGTSVTIIPAIWSAKAEGTLSWNDSNSNTAYGSNTRGYSVGRDYSVTDTESWAFTQSLGHSISQGGQDFWTISSEHSTIVSFKGTILPGQFGVFYRQATRLVLPGAVVAYNLCGAPEVVGETYLTDYAWSVDLAQGTECPPFPESSLPEPECFISPCSSGL